jgi:aminoglycoside/choline kinase family phosphotransferase
MAPDRAEAAARFLALAGWGGATRAALAGDASSRRYERLSRATGETAVLMDAPPATGEDVRPFTAIARHLAGLGLSAPLILAEDAEQGFLLLEDLGDALFARLLARDPAREAELYAAATDVLVALHRHPAPADLPRLDATTMPPLVAPVFDWYHAGATGRPARPEARAALEDALAEALDCLAPVSRPVLILRDYHAENLIWLPGREGAARVGLLDFQDARAGHPAYDLVSLLEDARRDVAEPTRQLAIRRYIEATGAAAETFEAALAVQGAQRNLRILGVFARLSLHFGKAQYVDMIPRVWAHLRRDLAHPALAAVARTTAPLPAPDPALLKRLKDLCGTVPTP